MSTSTITNTHEYFDLVNPSYISWEFYSQYIDKEPPFGDLGLIVYLRTYSRFVEELSRREKWCECCLRTVEYSVSLDNKSPVEWKKAEAEKLFDMMFNMRGFPAGRTLWMGDKNKAIAQTANFNCSFRVIDSISAYSEIIYLLMVGAGAGFSVQNEYVSKLPTFNTDFKVDHIPFVKQSKVANQDDTVLELADDHDWGYVCKKTFTEQDLIKPEGYFIPTISDISLYTEAKITVGDSRVGWSNALRLFLELLTHTNIKNISINYNLIRPKGARLKTFGGRASGYAPLKTFFRKAEWLIKNCGGKFTSVVAMDLANIIAEVVVVAGVRRSSEIGIGDAWDVAFKTAKYDLFRYDPGFTSSGLELVSDDGNMSAVEAIAETYEAFKYQVTIADIIADDAEHGGLLPTLAKRFDLWDTQDPKNVEVQKLVDSVDPKFRYRESRVMSNNSIGLQTKPSREELETLVTFIKNNGEPGLFNYEAGRKRRADFQGSNPCFTGDMRLLTSDGYKTFSDLSVSDDIALVDYVGRVRRGKVWSNGIKPCVELRLSNDVKLRCTADHRWMTSQQSSVQASELKNQQLMPFISKPYHDSSWVRYGFIQGDGNTSRLLSETHKGIEVNIGDNDTDIYGLFSSVSFTKNKSGRVIYLNDSKDMAVISRIGYSTSTLPERVLPLCYSSLNKAEKAAFLSGCYSANGSVLVSARHVTYKSTCRELLEQIQDSLLEDFNINSYITTNKPKDVEFVNGSYKCKESHDLNIASYEDRLAFYNQIGFAQTYKTERLLHDLINSSPFVTSIKKIQPQEVFDFSLDYVHPIDGELDTHWGVVEGRIAHNCGEILLRNKAVCNLTEGNLRAYVRPDKSFDFLTFESDLRLLTRIGSRVTLVKMWHPDWDTVQSEDRLLGVSLTGQCDAWLAMGNPSDTVKNEILAFAKRIVRDEEEKYHSFLGIPRSKLTTTGKPSGTIAQLPTVSSGCHQPYAPYYFRNVRISSTDPLARVLLEAGVPVAPNGNKGTLEESDTWVFTFPVKTNAQIKSVDEPVLEQLERYKNLMQHYVEHNQSVTISVAPDEWDLVVNWLDENWDNFVGISFLPKFDSTIGEDGSFPQMPYVTANEERYNEMLPKFPRLQEDQLIEMIAQYEKSQEEYTLEDSCSTGACPVR